MARPRSTNVNAGADGMPGGVGEGIAACSSVQVIASILTMSPAHRYAEARSTPIKSDIRPVAMPVAAGHLFLVVRTRGRHVWLIILSLAVASVNDFYRAVRVAVPQPHA